MFTSSKKREIRHFPVVFAQCGKEMYKRAWCTCRVVVCLFNQLLFWRSRCRRTRGILQGRDPFNQNSNRSDREKRTTSKGGPFFSKLFRLDRTDPLSFGPKFPEILVEWIAPLKQRRRQRQSNRHPKSEFPLFQTSLLLICKNDGYFSQELNSKGLYLSPGRYLSSQKKKRKSLSSVYVLHKTWN